MKSMFKSLHLVLMSLAIIAMLGCEEKTNSNQEIKSDEEKFNLFTGIDGTEIENLRSEYSKTFQLSNGKVVTRFSAQKVHELVNGQWIDIDYNKKLEKSTEYFGGTITGTLKYTRTSSITNTTTTEYMSVFDNLGSYPDYFLDDQYVTYNNENSRLAVAFNGINTVTSYNSVTSVTFGFNTWNPVTGLGVSRSEVYGDIAVKLFTSNEIFGGSQAHYDACSEGTTLGTITTNGFSRSLSNASLKNAVSNAISNGKVSFSLVSSGALCSVANPYLDIYYDVKLTMSRNPINGGTVNVSDGDHIYSLGTNVNLIATPSSGWKFKNWTGSTTSTNPNISLPMTSNKTATANFELKQRFLLSTVVNPSGSGSISLSPAPGADGKYEEGALVTATATASSGWQFEYWSGASNSQSNQISFTVNSNTSLAAKFILQSPITGPNGLMPLQSGTYSTSFPGASYFKWSRDGVYLGTGSTKSIQMPEPVYQMVITVDAFDSQNNVIARGRKVVGQI